MGIVQVTWDIFKSKLEVSMVIVPSHLEYVLI